MKRGHPWLPALAAILPSLTCNQPDDLQPAEPPAQTSQQLVSEAQHSGGGHNPTPPQPPLDPADNPRTCEEALPPPRAKQPPGPLPSVIIAGRVLHQPPPLAGRGEAAVKSARAFLEWAAGSFPEEREDGRKVIAAARGNDDISRALIGEVEKTVWTDHPRALLGLSILGEMRNRHAARFLAEFVRRPAPEIDERRDGELVAGGALALLQAKAVGGLAYLRDPLADVAVLEAVARHPSRVVRAEAVRSYLFNNPRHGQAVLKHLVSAGDRPLLQRVEHVVPGKGPEDFNRRLEAFLAANPHLRPPVPRRKLSCGLPGSPPNPAGESPPIP